MAVTSLPYLLVMAIAPSGSRFSGFMWNPDDHCVYLAWMQQARAGDFFFRNLFTSEEQRGVYTNLFFWLLGNVCRVTGLSAPAVLHGARFLFGVTTLLLAYRLMAFTTPAVPLRRWAFTFVAVSAGVGWLPFFWERGVGGPVDVWQPEAITFASLYTNGLFCVSLTLMLGIVCLLLRAEESGRARDALVAGALGFLLANIHGYDVITLTAVWIAYLGASVFVARRLPACALKMACLAGLVALPSVAYQGYTYLVEPVFRERVAVPTTSPSLWRYLLGYGLLLPLALVGAFGAGRCVKGSGLPVHAEASIDSSDFSPSVQRQTLAAKAVLRLLLVWAVVGFAVPYLPVSFQRKMVMGLHVPLALLATWGAWILAGRLRSHGERMVTAAMGGLLLVTALTSPRWIARDLSRAVLNQASTGIHPVFWPDRELEAMRWLRHGIDRRAVLLSSTVTGCMIPAVAGRAVYAGHWGETPRFTERFREVWSFFRLDWPSREREAFLRRRGITHLYVGLLERNLRLAPDPRYPAAPVPPPLDFSREPYLRRVYPPPDQPEPGPEGVAVYEVVTPLPPPRLRKRHAGGAQGAGFRRKPLDEEGGERLEAGVELRGATAAVHEDADADEPAVVGAHQIDHLLQGAAGAQDIIHDEGRLARLDPEATPQDTGRAREGTLAALGGALREDRARP